LIWDDDRDDWSRDDLGDGITPDPREFFDDKEEALEYVEQANVEGNNYRAIHVRVAR